MQHPSIFFRRSALKVAFCAAFASSLNTAIAADPAYIVKSLGAQTVRLPMLAGFPAACEESTSLAARAAALAPKSSNFVTCFAPADKWRLFQEGQAADLYPYLTVAVDPPHPSGPFTSREFQQLRQATRAKLGDLGRKSNEAQMSLQEQDARIAERGGDLKRENYRQQLSGFFDIPSKLESFSFFVSRSAKVSEADANTAVCEVNAATTILYSGRLLRVSVIDDCSGATQGLRARAITAAWLTALSDLNAERR
ncbi:hypothetical protein J2X90_005967 [Variovorax paradoxus]|uniref:hypothetical protein n=1 Tax=Variovorax paradoxus TaxID=34073 RepID=UPI002780FC02|nr:hypothetical protein [Variovorax paradoxus]MDQ0028114.1 hypothetical protein [Variovorax paradoxus]